MSARCWCGFAELINLITIVGRLYSRTFCQEIAGWPSYAARFSAGFVDLPKLERRHAFAENATAGISAPLSPSPVVIGSFSATVDDEPGSFGSVADCQSRSGAPRGKSFR